MKASSRLIKALIALAASVVLCIGVCLAWFASNGEVDSSGLSTVIKSSNIKTYTVKAISLSDKKEGANGTYTYTVGDEIIGTSVKMEEYGNIQGKATAVLLAFECTFYESTGKYYDLGASFSINIEDPVVKDATLECDLMCCLSDVLTFFETDITTSVKKGDKVTRGSALAPDEDGSKIDLNGGEAYDGELTYTFYCIIDYSENAIEQKYLYALNNIDGCSLNSQMRFEDNMIFYATEV